MKKRASRSRNGCLRCKERRLKCDETHPACQQCQIRKLTCPGYQMRMRWSAKYEVLGNQQQSSSAQTHTDATSVPQQARQMRGNAQTDQAQRHDLLLIQEPDVAGSAMDFAADCSHQDNVVHLSLPSHISSPTHHNEPVLDSSNHSHQAFHPVPRALSPLREHDAADDDWTSFELTDQNFWSSLTLDWSPMPIEPIELPRPLMPAQADLSAADDVSSTVAVDKNLPSFDPSDVTDKDTKILLKHYFDNILSINSVCDDRDNPFRYLVSGYIKSSPLVRSCVLSVSEMHLMSNNRNMHQSVVRYHSDALKCIATAMEQFNTAAPPAEQESIHRSGCFLSGYVDRLQEALLALLLLGVSSSWLDPSNIGINHLVSARRLFSKWMNAVDKLSSGSTRSAIDERNTSFIIGAMAYWEMIIAFVASQAIDVLDYLEPFLHQKDKQKIYPNPWTGISTPIFIVMAQVGVCIRQKLVISSLQSLGWPPSTYGSMLDALLRRAASLVTFALEYEPPIESQVHSNHESPLTTFPELELMGHTYKLAAVLELYRCFPQLDHIDDGTVSSSVDVPGSGPSVLSMPCRVADDGLDGQASSHNNTNTTIYELAVGLLGMLKQTEERRATSLAHTLALLIGGSALQHSQSGKSRMHRQNNRGQSVRIRARVTNLLAHLNSKMEVVEGWRSFVRQRLRSNADYVGLDSFRRTQALMEEIWSRLDRETEQTQSSIHETSVPVQATFGPLTAGRVSAHWIDVMTECRLETLFG